MITEIIGGAASLLGAGANMIAGNQTRKIGATYGLTGLSNGVGLGRNTGQNSELVTSRVQQQKTVTTGAGDTWGAIGQTLGAIGGAISVTGNVINGVADSMGAGSSSAPQNGPIDTSVFQGAVGSAPAVNPGVVIPAQPAAQGVIPQATKPMARLESGGKGADRTASVEAEGGEVLVEFDDDYNILSVKPIQGPSHEGGGVELALGKNQAILNHRQQQALREGAPLRQIVESLPEASDTAMADDGASNRKPKVTAPRDARMTAGYIPGVDLGSLAGDFKWPVPKTIEIPRPPDYPPAVPQNPYGLRPLSEVQAENYKEATDARLLAVEAKGRNWTPDFEGAQAPEELPGFKLESAVEPPVALDQEVIPDGLQWLISLPGGITPVKPAGVAQAGVDPARGFRFGPREATLLSDNIRNLAALFQPSAEPVGVEEVSPGEVATVTHTRTSPRPYLDENTKNFRAAMASLAEHGQHFLIPSLFLSNLESSGKIASQITAQDNEAQQRANALNAEVMNRSSLAGAELRARTRDLLTSAEIEKSRIDAAKVNERVSAAANLPLAWARYKKSAEDDRYSDRMKRLLYYQMAEGIR